MSEKCSICQLCINNPKAEDIIHNRKFLLVMSSPQVMDELIAAGVDIPNRDNFDKLLGRHYRKHLSSEKQAIYKVQAKRTKYRKDKNVDPEYSSDSLKALKKKQTNYSLDMVDELKRHLYMLKLQTDAYEKYIRDREKTQNIPPSHADSMRLTELTTAYAKETEVMIKIASIQSIWKDLVLRIFDKLTMGILQRHLEVAERVGMTAQDREILMKALHQVIDQNIAELDKLCKRYLP